LRAAILLRAMTKISGDGLPSRIARNRVLPKLAANLEAAHEPERNTLRAIIFPWRKG